jgi:RHS repeat-associated protein
MAPVARAGGSTTLGYDANGNLPSLTDPKNGVTSYGPSYYNMGRLTSRTDPLSHADSYTAYDANGNLTSSTDRLGRVTTYQYDALNRLTFIGFGTVGTPPSATYESTISYTYDAGDRLLTAVDSAAGTDTLGYDDFDRLTSETNPQGSTSYTYDNADRRATMTLAGQPSVTYGYDAADRLTSISQGSASVGFTYDDAGRPLTETLPNGVVGAYTYDDASHLTGISYALGQTTLGDLAYTYDAAGHRTSVGGSLARITLPTALGSATYNAASRITAWDALSPTYDNAGQMTSDGTYTYTWNARGELTQVKQGAATIATYAYDAFGRRTNKTISGTTTRFAYDGTNLIQEQDGAGTPIANMLTGGVDEVFSRTDSAGSRYFLSDAIGSTVGLTDGSGAIATSYTYEPFGKTTTTGATSANSQQFTGRENDGALYYYRARYLHPTFGRFLSEDPLSFAAGDANLQAYVGNNPVCRTDPTGRFVNILIGCGVGAGVNAGFTVVSNLLGHRKFTLGDVVGSAVVGCAFGAGAAFLEGAFAVEEIAEFGNLTRAEQFGIRPYEALQIDLRGLGLNAHHQIEKRFADIFQQQIGEMASIAVTVAEHRIFTNAWFGFIRYGAGTATATRQVVEDAARQIYSDYPAILRALGL